MKMRNYRLLTLGFVTVSFVLLTGFQKPGVNHALLTEQPTGSVDVKAGPVKSKQQKTTNKHSIAQNAEPQQPLDLTVPFFKASENAAMNIGHNRRAGEESANIFSIEQKKKQQSLDLDGQMLMSQEPEADKQKTLDGAAIVINLKR